MAKKKVAKVTKKATKLAKKKVAKTKKAILAREPTKRGRATAMTFADDDRGLPPREVTGQLSRRYVETLQYWQYTIESVAVNPDTIRYLN